MKIFSPKLFPSYYFFPPIKQMFSTFSWICSRIYSNTQRYICVSRPPFPLVVRNHLYLLYQRPIARTHPFVHSLNFLHRMLLSHTKHNTIISNRHMGLLFSSNEYTRLQNVKYLTMRIKFDLLISSMEPSHRTSTSLNIHPMNTTFYVVLIDTFFLNSTWKI